MDHCRFGTHVSHIRMMDDVRIVKEDMGARYPDRIQQAQDQAVQKIFSGGKFGNEICANQEYDQPEKWLSHGRHKGNSYETHSQSKQRQAEKKSPIHVVGFIVNKIDGTGYH